MKRKGIKSSLYLPSKCFNIIETNYEEVKNYLESRFDINYTIYLGEYGGEEICGVDVSLIAETFREVSRDYTDFKAYLKKITGKTPKMIFKAKFERI